MTVDEMRDWTRRNPFVPFRVRHCDGRTFEVRDMSEILVNEDLCIMVSDRGDDGIADRTEHVRWHQIERIEPLEAAV